MRTHPDWPLIVIGVAYCIGMIGVAAMVGPMFQDHDVSLIVSMVIGASGGILGGRAIAIGLLR